MALKQQQTQQQHKEEKECEWGYTKDNGPEVWIERYHHGAGKNQSPVDIKVDATTFAPELNNLPMKINWPHCYSTLCNTGASWRLSPQEGTEMTLIGGPLGDQSYQLLQAHAHWPAEHMIDSEQYELEVHFVHINKKYATLQEALRHRNGLAVVGILYSSRAKSRRQEDMRDLLSVLCDMCSEIQFRDDTKDLSDEPIDWQAFLPDDLTRYYTYSGSLTTPPLNECVTWILMREVCRVDVAQLKTLRSMCALSRTRACEMGCIGTDMLVPSNGKPNGHSGTSNKDEQRNNNSNNNSNGRVADGNTNGSSGSTSSEEDVNGTKSGVSLEPHLLTSTCRPVQPLNSRKVYRSWN